VATDLLDTVDASAFHGELPLQLRFSIVLEAPPLHIQDPDFMVIVVNFDSSNSNPCSACEACVALCDLCLCPTPLRLSGDLPRRPHVRPHRTQGDQAASQRLRDQGRSHAHARYTTCHVSDDGALSCGTGRGVPFSPTNRLSMLLLHSDNTFREVYFPLHFPSFSLPAYLSLRCFHSLLAVSLCASSQAKTDSSRRA
jgi:hypothetical protein